MPIPQSYPAAAASAADSEKQTKPMTTKPTRLRSLLAASALAGLALAPGLRADNFT